MKTDLYQRITNRIVAELEQESPVAQALERGSTRRAASQGRCALMACRIRASTS